MKRLLVLALLLLGFTLPAFSRAKLQGWVEQGNTTVTITGGIGNITRKVQGSYPGATVTVYLSGTVTLASLYTDNSGTVKANPFTSSADGTWFFYADDGRYDVRFSGGSIAVPFTLGDFVLSDSSVGEYCNPKSNGAVGDGVHDDTSAIQSCINRVGPTGGQVFIPQGQYLITSSLVITYPIRFQGVQVAAYVHFSPTNKGTVLISGITDGSDVIDIRGWQWDSDVINRGSEEPGLYLSDFKIMGVGTEGNGIDFDVNTAHPATAFATSLGVTYRNIQIFGVGGTGVNFTSNNWGVFNGLFERLDIWNSGVDGIAVRSTDVGGRTPSFLGTDFKNCSIQQSGRYGIYNYKVQSINWENIVEAESAVDSYYLFKANGNRFRNCIGEGAETGVVWRILETSNATWYDCTAQGSPLTADDLIYIDGGGATGTHLTFRNFSIKPSGSGTPAGKYHIHIVNDPRDIIFKNTDFFSESPLINDAATSIGAAFVDTYDSTLGYTRLGTKYFNTAHSRGSNGVVENAVGEADVNAMLDLRSTTRGFRAPQMTTAQRTTLGAAMGATQSGMIVGDTTSNQYFIWDGTVWYPTRYNTNQPEYYGCIANGVFNCKSAFDSAKANGEIQLSEGTYLLGTPVNLISNLTVRGVPGKSIITTSGDTIMFTTNAVVSNIKFDGITFLGLNQNFAVGENAAAIRFVASQASKVTIINCKFLNLPEGIHAQTGTNEVQVRTNTFFGISGPAIYIQASENWTITGNDINGDRTGIGDGIFQKNSIYVKDNGGNPGTGGSNCLITSNQIRNAFGPGLLLSGAYILASNNELSNIHDLGAGATPSIWITSATSNTTPGVPASGYYNSVTNNIIHDGDYGIRAAGVTGDSPKDVLIANNDIRDITGSGKSGIEILSVANTDNLLRYKVSGNKIYDIYGSGNANGISLYSVNNSLISDNFIEHVGVYGIILDSGSITGGTCNNVTIQNNQITDVGVNSTATGIYLNPRGASSMANIVVDSNKFFSLGANRAIDIAANATNGSTDLTISRNVLYGDTTNTTFGMRLAGQRLTIVDNVGYNIKDNEVIIFTSSGPTYYSILEFRGFYTIVTAALSGASVTLTNAIPANTLLHGVMLKVTTGVTGSANFDVGDGTDVDRFGAAIADTLGTLTSFASATAVGPWIYGAATSIVLTANGGNFSGGVLKVHVYMETSPPAY